MWEAIRRNKRWAWVLVLCMGLLLVLMGLAIGEEFDRHQQGMPSPGGMLGAVAGALLAVVLSLYGWFFGDRAVLRTAGAVEISKEDAPQLWNVVEEMVLASGTPGMPKLYLVEDSGPNAFTVGRRPELASITVTSGLLKRLDRDELQGVIGHEIGHVQNYDIRFLTLASVLLGAIILVSHVFLRTGGRRTIPKERPSPVLIAVAILFALLAPVLARLLYFACSRRREYLADACSARYTRYPEGLASALEKIGKIAPLVQDTNQVLAALYIVNPLQSPTASNIFSTHPPLVDRIAILRAMGGMAGYVDYQRAFEARLGGHAKCMSPSFLKDQTSVTARSASAAESTHIREGLNLLDRAANRIVLTCSCGLRLKIPPGIQSSEVRCPRCGRMNSVPQPQANRESGGELTYSRQTEGWESFRCACGHTLQLSPTFEANRMNCPECGRRIEIRGPATMSATSGSG